MWRHFLRRQLRCSTKEEAGSTGGDAIVSGAPDDVMHHATSLTGQYLSGRLEIEAPQTKRKDMSPVNLSEVFDRLSFPALTAGLIAASSLTSTRVLYNNRAFLDEFSETLDKHRHPRRALWLTDSYTDRNGVSTAEYVAGRIPGKVSIEVTVRSTVPTEEELLAARDLALAVTDYDFY